MIDVGPASVNEEQDAIMARCRAAAEARSAWLKQPPGDELVVFLKCRAEQANREALQACEVNGSRDASVAAHARARAYEDLLGLIEHWKLSPGPARGPARRWAE